ELLGAIGARRHEPKGLNLAYTPEDFDRVLSFVIFGRNEPGGSLPAHFNDSIALKQDRRFSVVASHQNYAAGTLEDDRVLSVFVFQQNYPVPLEGNPIKKLSRLQHREPGIKGTRLLAQAVDIVSMRVHTLKQGLDLGREGLNGGITHGNSL